MNFSTQVISFKGNIFMSFMRQARDISIRMTVKGNGARIYPRGQMHQIYLSIFVQRDQLPPLIHRQSQTFLQQQSHNKNKIQGRVHVPTLLPTMQPSMASHHNHHFRQLCPNSEVSLSSSSLIFFSPPDEQAIDLICGRGNKSHKYLIYGRSIYCSLVAASAWARRLAEVEPPLK